MDLCSEQESFGVARAACFEELAGVFASSGTLHYAKILASLKIKNDISLTTLSCVLNAFALVLNVSADAAALKRLRFAQNVSLTLPR